MTMHSNFLQNGKQILEAYKKDNSSFKTLRSLGYEAFAPLIIELIQEIFLEGNLSAMQAIIDAGFVLNEDDHKRIISGVFVPRTAIIKNDTYYDLRKPIKQAHLETNFYHLLELLLFKFNYVLNLNELHFLLNDLSYKKRFISQEMLSWFVVVQNSALKCERWGHVLGLSGSLNASLPIAKTQNVQTTMSFEGSYDIRSYNILINKLNEYKNSLSNKSPIIKHIDKIITSFTFMSNHLVGLTGYNPNAPTILRERYKNDELTNLIAGCDRHSFALSLYKGYLIYTNRGEGGDQDFGTKIYKIHGLVTPQWVKQILDKSRDMPQALEILKRVIDFSNPIACFPSKGQKRGTCSYVNILASVEAQICLLEADSKKKLTPVGIAQIAQQMTEPAMRSQGEYKKFTIFNRFTEINTLINEMKDNYKNKSGLDDFYFEICKAIIAQHQGKTANALKCEHEKLMVAQLYETLAENEKRVLLLYFQIKHITDLFIEKQPLMVSEEDAVDEAISFEEEYIEETFLTLPKPKNPHGSEVDKIHQVIDSLEHMDVETKDVLVYKSHHGSFARYFDTLRKIGEKSKNLVDLKKTENKHRYEKAL